VSLAFPKDSCAKRKRKLADGVWLLNYGSIEHGVAVHVCEGRGWFTVMTYRENFDGPNYWCSNCGYVVPEGLAMAIRMNELEI
jgi:hypothetical protein